MSKKHAVAVAEAPAATEKPQNIFLARFRSPLPEKLPEYMVLWEKHLAAAALLKDAEDRDDAEAVRVHSAERDRLLAEMRPLTFVRREIPAPNLVTNLGRNMILDTFWRGSGYTQTIRMGLKGTGSPAPGDTQASHAGWLEVGGANAPVYTGNRQAFTMAAAASQQSVSPTVTFSFTSSGTVAGMFVNNGGSATKDDTTATLVSATDFSTGSEAVSNLDTLDVVYTFNG